MWPHVAVLACCAVPAWEMSTNTVLPGSELEGVGLKVGPACQCTAGQVCMGLQAPCNIVLADKGKWLYQKHWCPNTPLRYPLAA